jgi:hypothetical protein
MLHLWTHRRANLGSGEIIGFYEAQALRFGLESQVDSMLWEVQNDVLAKHVLCQKKHVQQHVQEQQ